MRERDFGTLPVTGLLHVEQGEFYHEALDAMRTGEANFAALLIEGNPISEEELEKKMLAIARGLGEPFVDGGETDSFQSVQTIIPDPKMADEQVSSSSREELYLHSENAGMANMPDWVIIGCARNTEGAETTLVDPVRVFNGLSEENKQSLRQPVYYIQEPFSFTLAAGRRVRRRIRENIPVFDEQQSVRRPTVIADFEAMGSDSSTHQLAFHDFLEVAREQATALTLQAGSVLIIRNTAINNGTASDSQRFVMALHGRNPFAPNWEQPRILKRVFVRGQPSFSR